MEMGMSKFVKLTNARTRNVTLVNARKVIFADWDESNNASDIWLQDIEDGCISVTETPEQILALIEGPSGDYEPF